MASQEVKAFDRLSSQFSLLQTPVNVLRKMTNTLVINGGIEKRKPWTTISSPAQGAVGGFFEFKFSTSTRGVLFKQASAPYHWYRSTGAALNVHTDLGANTGSPTDNPQFARYNETIYAVDGTVAPHKLCTLAGGNLTWTQQGLVTTGYVISTPPVAGAVVTTADWTVGYYDYMVSFVQTTDQGVIESNRKALGAILITPTVTNCPQITGTAMGSPPAGLSAVRIYRQNYATGQTDYYFIKEMATTTGAFVFEDNGAGTGNRTGQDLNRVAPTDHTQLTIPATTISIYKDRAFYGYGANLYFSLVGFPEYCPAANVIKVGGSEDIITGHYAFPNYLLIQKQRGFWILEGSTFADFNLRPVLPHGCPGIRGSIFVNNVLYWISSSGIWRWDIGSPAPVNIGNEIFQDIEGCTANFADSSCVGHDPKNNLIFFGLTGNDTYIYDPERGAFIGNSNISSPANCMGQVGLYSNRARLGVFHADTTLKVYDEDPAVSGTVESSATFEAYTGMLFTNGEKHSIDKNFVGLSLYDRLGFTVTSSDEENISINLNNADRSTAQQLDTYSLNDLSVYMKGKQGGWKFNAAGLIISGTGLAFTKQWSILGFDLEYERIGIIQPGRGTAGR